MANHPSAERRNRQRVKRTKRNKAVRGATRTLVKAARITVASGDPEAVAKAIQEVASAADRAASKGVIHSRAAARTKARIARRANKAAAAAKA